MFLQLNIMLNDVHDMVKRNKNLQKRFLTNNGWDILAKHGICNLLANALSEEDFNWLEKENVWFNPVSSPASHFKIEKEIPANSNIINIDIPLMIEMKECKWYLQSCWTSYNQRY